MTDTISKIKLIIKTKIRPILAMDGGNIEYIDYSDGILRVKLLGQCNGCPLSAITLKRTVETLIREEIPELISVEAIESEEDEE